MIGLLVKHLQAIVKKLTARGSHRVHGTKKWSSQHQQKHRMGKYQYFSKFPPTCKRHAFWKQKYPNDVSVLYFDSLWDTGYLYLLS